MLQVLATDGTQNGTYNLKVRVIVQSDIEVDDTIYFEGNQTFRVTLDYYCK